VYATARDYFESINPEAADLMPDYDEDTAWLIAQSEARGLRTIFPTGATEPLFTVELLHERFN
jgi:hypothetical protein